MNNLYRIIKEIDYLIVFLYCYASLVFWGSEISNELNLLVSSTIISYLYLKRSRHNQQDLPIIILVCLLLFLNILINGCGLGAILGYLEFFLLMLLSKDLRISKSTFTLLFYTSFIATICFGYRLMQHPEYFSIYSVDENVMNANMVGIYMFYLSSFVIMFCPTKSLINNCLVLISLVVSLLTIWLSECRSAQAAFFILVTAYLFSIIKKQRIEHKHVNLVYRFSILLLFGGIIFVYISILSSSDFFLEIIGDISSFLGNDKGATLSNRGNMWKEAIDAFYHNPLLGTGSKFRLRSYGDEALALHNSTLNLLIVYGVIIYIISIVYLRRLLLQVRNSEYYNHLIFVALGAYCAVLVISYFESNLMDYFKLYSMMPLMFACSVSNLQCYE